MSNFAFSDPAPDVLRTKHLMKDKSQIHSWMQPPCTREIELTPPSTKDAKPSFKTQRYLLK